jgi:hypothetical protein
MITYLVCLLKEAIEEADCIVGGEPVSFTEIFPFNNEQSLYQYLHQLEEKNIPFLVVHQGTVMQLLECLPTTQGGAA